LRTGEILTVGQAGVEQLHEQNAGRVFAYCYARVGSRNVAEWVANATFDRARAALGNGGIPEPQLDWLLRTADKFCAPQLCLDGRRLESMVVLQDWCGRSFDEIADELDARYTRLEEERSRLTPWRRVLGAFNVGPALSWIKGLVGALGAAKATVAGVAVVGAIAVVGTPLGMKLHDVVRSDSTPPAPAVRPPRSGGGSVTTGVVTATPVSAQGSVPSGGQAIPKSVGAADMPKNGARGHSASGGAGAASGTTVHEAGAASNHGGALPQAPAGATTGAAPTSAATTVPNAPAPTKTPSLPAVSTPTVAPTASGTSLPRSPSTPTPPTARSLPTIDTPTVPTVETSTTPSVVTPTAPSVDTPTLPSASTPPRPPAVTVPSRPPVDPPAVMLPK